MNNVPSQDEISSALHNDVHDAPRKDSLALHEHQEMQIARGVRNATSSLVYEEQARCTCMTLSDVIHNLMDVSLLTNYVFLLFNLCGLIFSLGIRIPFVYIPHRATELGLATEESSSYLIAVIGVSNTLGRLVLGAWADKTSISRLSLFNVILMINGLSNFATSLITKYYQMVIYCSVFGATFGENYFLTFPP